MSEPRTHTHLYRCEWTGCGLPLHKCAAPEAGALRDALEWWAGCVRRMFEVAPIDAVASETGTTDREDSIRIVDEWLARDANERGHDSMHTKPAGRDGSTGWRSASRRLIAEGDTDD